MVGPWGLRRANAWSIPRIRSLFPFNILEQAIPASSVCIYRANYSIYKYDSSLIRSLATFCLDAAPLDDGDDAATAAAAPASAASLLNYASLKADRTRPWESSIHQQPSGKNLTAETTPNVEKKESPLSGRISYFLRSFRRNAAMRAQALKDAHINDELFTISYFELSKLLQTVLSPEAATAFESLDTTAAHAILLKMLISHAEKHHSNAIESHKTLVTSLDLRHPHTWFPMARCLQRKIIYHAGPTNSGKTFNALTAMRGASSGLYCGPLRLLAMEVYDSCNADGTFCNLVTGQEKRDVPGAAHTACTVEMASLSQRVDVAVIDEIQMIGDTNRGFAWTRALLGIPAAEIHVCGDASAVELVKWMAQQMNENFELITYNRFTPLLVEPKGLKQKSYSFVRPGDCVVAFSRTDIFAIKEAIEASTRFKAAVIYGALPPEVRRRQARLFNDPESGYKVMVASDAVGMGLNLNIGRVIFHSLHKRQGGRSDKKRVEVSPSAVKQIAGRAGRRSSNYKHGKTTCMDSENIPLLEQHLAVPLDTSATPRAGLTPEFDQFEAFSSQRPENTLFSTLLKEFDSQAMLHGRKYFFCRQEAMMETVNLVESIPGLSLKDIYIFAMAPASGGDPRIMAALLHWAKKYAQGVACPLEITPPAQAPKNADQMRALETAHSIVTLWLWLSYRFTEVESFVTNRESAQEIGEKICELLGKGLENITKKKEEEEIGDKKEVQRRKKLGVVNRQRVRQMQKNSTNSDAYPELFAAFQEEMEIVKAALLAEKKGVGKSAEKEKKVMVAAEVKKKKGRPSRKIVAKLAAEEDAMIHPLAKPKRAKRRRIKAATATNAEEKPATKRRSKKG
jgi:ATP-dependent RNA helicase SUPV3L1/SUV3